MYEPVYLPKQHKTYFQVLVPRHPDSEGYQESTKHNNFVTLTHYDDEEAFYLRFESGNYDYDRKVDKEEVLSREDATDLMHALDAMLNG